MSVFEGYKLTSPFGWRIHPVYQDRRFHTGVDLVKAHKAPIHAFTGGAVIFADFGKSGSGFGDYGNVVAIEDRDDKLHCYCHLDSAAVQAGQTIEQGEVIGHQGNTGVGTGSHLHYEIRKKASPNYGWTIAEDRCYEPTAYLEQYYAKYSEKADSKVMIPILINGKPLMIKGYFVDGTNYASIRDLAEGLGFRVDWDGTNILIATGKEQRV